MKPRLRLAALAGAALGMAIPIGFATGASAASDYSGAQFQVTFSLNCVNPTAPCQNVFGLGGQWGWIALMPDGTGNAQVTGCGHVTGGPRGGAGHESYDPTWTMLHSDTPPTPTTPADPNGNYLDISGSPDGHVPELIVPASYGHYSFTFMGAFGQETIAP